MARTVGQHAAAEMQAQGRGLRIIAILAVLTLVEYVIAVAVSSPAGLVVLLSVTALVKAWLIVVYFMHLPLVWRNDGGHQ
jgi:heme/copper-type cytochrome/quinol oxidase subunit 4